MSSGGSMFRKTKSAPADLEKSGLPKKSGGVPKRRRLLGRRKKSNEEAPTHNNATLKVMGWTATGTEQVTIAMAKMQEKAEHFWIRVRYNCFACTHCIHIFRKRAARKAAKQKTLRATDIRAQKELAAKSKAAGKRLDISEARRRNSQAKMQKEAAKQEEGEKANLLS